MSRVYYQPELDRNMRIVGHTTHIPSFLVWRNKENLLESYPNCIPIEYKGNDIKNPTYMDLEEYVDDLTNYNDNDWDFNRGPDHLSKEAVFQIFKNLNKEDREWLINKVNLREYE